MDYTSDSDISENNRDLVSQGLASVKRIRFSTASQVERIRDRVPLPNMDTSNVRSPLRREAVNDDTSIHGLVYDREIVNGQNLNNKTKRALCTTSSLSQHIKLRQSNTAIFKAYTYQ